MKKTGVLHRFSCFKQPTHTKLVQKNISGAPLAQEFRRFVGYLYQSTFTRPRMANATSSKTAIYAAIGANLAIAISKFIAAGFTGSSAMLSEGIHSVVDTGNGLLLLLGITEEPKRAPDATSPLRARQRVIFLVADCSHSDFFHWRRYVLLRRNSHIRHPKPLTDPTWNYVVLGLAACFESVALYLALKQFNTTRRRAKLYEGTPGEQRSVQFCGNF